MPITPFHFGPGAALHAMAPRHVSFIAFCGANVLIDVESLHNMVTRQEQVHAFFHTYVGATLVAAATIALLMASLWIARQVRLPNPWRWQQLGAMPITVGAAAGAYSHVLLDSVMHADITPLMPFSASNVLLGWVSLSTLHWFCLASGAFALVLMGIRRLLADAPPAR
jgi:membrane-bound metal-dependent hydrolase YbcI (DUF457 family)